MKFYLYDQKDYRSDFSLTVDKMYKKRYCFSLNQKREKEEILLD